jgi:hypothetical protein
MIRNFILLAILIFISSCAKPDHQRDLELLISYQKDAQTAHLQNNPELLIRHFVDTLTQIRNGVVSRETKTAMKERFSNYFGSVHFKSWEDITQPIITISDDATLAQIMVQKKVELFERSDTTHTRHTTNFAWTELWKKKNGEWKLYVVTTTDDQ